MSSRPQAAPPQREPARKRQRRPSAAEIESIESAYAADTSISSLAAEYAIAKTSVSELVDRSGVAKREQRLMTDEDIKVARHLSTDGVPLVRISKQLGFSRTAIRARLRALTAVE